MSSNLEHHVRLAKEGDPQALEHVVSGVKETVYGLALRMLNHPEDAEDQTHEILIKMITHLSDYREESAFTTWVYRIACNHLLTRCKQQSNRLEHTFEQFGEMIETVTISAPPLEVSNPEKGVMLEEVRLNCLQAALMCLERDMRVAYILGEGFGVTSQEGACILDVTAEAFRARLSRARKSLQAFMGKHCGLVNPNNACKCHQMAAMQLNHADTQTQHCSILKKEVAVKGRQELLEHLDEFSEIDRTLQMYRRYPEYQTPDSFTHIVSGLIDSGKFAIFN